MFECAPLSYKCPQNILSFRSFSDIISFLILLLKYLDRVVCELTNTKNHGYPIGGCRTKQSVVVEYVITKMVSS